MHQAVVVGSVVGERWLDVVESLLVRGSDGLWVLVLDRLMSLLLLSLSARRRFSIIQHLLSASLATA